jgi:hypothetical protein
MQYKIKKEIEKVKKFFLALLVALVVFNAFVVVVLAAGPENGKGGNNNGKAKGHEKKEQQTEQQQSISGNDNPSESGNSSDSPNTGNGNTGNSKTRKGLDDTKENQNIYSEGDTLSYHVAKRKPGDYTVVVKKPGKNGEIVFSQDVVVGEDGQLNIELTEIPEDWQGVYQVQIIGEDGHMKNDNINIKKDHVSNPEDLPNFDNTPENNTPESMVIPESENVPESQQQKEEKGDCVTVVYHASNPTVTVVEFFAPEHASEPWLHEDSRLGESRVDSEGAVVAHFAQGVTFVVFEYNEQTGAYVYRATGEVVGEYENVIDVWSDGNETSTLFNALVWFPIGATK